MKTYRVLLVDDYPVILDGLEALLSVHPDITIVGTATDGAAALALIPTCKPEVILMDICMPTLDGIEATRRVRAAYPACRVILLTTFLSDEYIADGLCAGASGYLLKKGSTDYAQAIRAVADGDSVLHPSVAAKVISEYTRLVPSRQAPLDHLTEREVEVLRLVAHGRTNRDIADRLLISEATVKRHLSNIFGKLEVTDRESAAELARLRGLV